MLTCSKGSECKASKGVRARAVGTEKVFVDHRLRAGGLLVTDDVFKLKSSPLTCFLALMRL